VGDASDRLKEIRDRIDALDAELLELLNRRAALAREVAGVKRDEAPGEVYRPDREAEVLRRALAANAGPLGEEQVARLFREIMSACRALQKRMRVGYLGPEGTFTENAALAHFGADVDTVPLESIDAVFREVESGACDYGVVPVENSTEGVVSHTLDMFVRSTLSICGEVQLRIHHHVMGHDVAGRAGEDAGGEPAATALARASRVYSHQQSLAQCRKWLDTCLPEAERIAVSSNAEGARRAAAESGALAIAGEAAASHYGLTVLAANVEDEPDNTTRFLVIGDHAVPATGADKTSLLMSARNQPGALYRLIEPLASRQVSMTRIESRPSRSGLWEYVFFVDVEGHADDGDVRDALAEIGQHASLLKVLGSYPRASA